jgi:hypothetical protein
VPDLVHGSHGVHGVNLVQIYAHLSASSTFPVHADQFDVPHDPLELLHVPVLVHGLHGGSGINGLHPEQLHALISASRTTSYSS